MREKQLVSVIVPVYNVREYLDKCVSSILSQSYTNLEIILVDDGSTDGSGKAIDEYKSIDRRVIVIHKENGGLSSARNIGMKYANGDWLAFIDSDDYIDSNFIKHLLNIAHEQNADIVTSSFEPFSLDGSKLKNAPVWPEETMSGNEAINATMKNRLPVGICLSIFRRSIFLENGITFPEGREHEDLITRIQLLFYAKRVSFTNEKLYKYLSRKESITGKTLTESRYNDLFAGIKAIRSFLKRKNNIHQYQYINYFEFYSIFSIINYLAKEKKLNKNSKKLWRAARKELKKRFNDVVFPTPKKKVYYKVLLMITANRFLYATMYRKVKK